MLKGGKLRDVLIGGSGSDKLDGMQGDDLLVGGIALNALNQIFAEWRSDSLDLLSLWIVDDQEDDELAGQQGADVYLDGLGDKLKDLKASKGDRLL